MRLHRLSTALSSSIVAVAMVASSCSATSSRDAADAPDLVTVPNIASSDGDSCSDPTGDLDVGSTIGEDVLASLAGIDLVEASARPEGDMLDIRIETAGPIGLVPGATFYVAQGQPLESLSFEIRIVEDGGDWTVTVITWTPRENRRVVDVDPHVDGATLNVSVPLSDLPPIALMLEFGSSVMAPDGTLLIDDCSNLWSRSTPDVPEEPEVGFEPTT